MSFENIRLVLAFCVAFLVAFATTPLAEKAAYKVGAIDVPKDKRRMHKKPIPRLGGIAIYLGFMVAMLCFSVLTPEYLGIFLGATMIVALGVLDDRKPIKAIISHVAQMPTQILTANKGIANIKHRKTK